MTNFRLRTFFASEFLFFMCLAAPGSAQSLPSGFGTSNLPVALYGSVESVNGKPLSDIQIELRNPWTGALLATRVTSQNGEFAFDGLPAGSYEIRAFRGVLEVRRNVNLNQVSQRISLRLPYRVPKGGDATVSLIELQVPEKARREVEKGWRDYSKYKMDNARKHCAKALAIAPGYSRALALSALLSAFGGKLDLAVHQAERSVQSDPSFAKGYVVLASLYNSASRYHDALRAIDQATPLVPSSWQMHYEKARALLGKGDYQLALQSTDKAMETAPASYVPVHVTRANALLGLKAYSEAIVEFEKSISLDPTGPEAARSRKKLREVQAYVDNAD